MAVKKENVVMVDGSKIGIWVNNYNGKLSLVKVNEGQGEVLYQQWAYLPAKGKNAGPSEQIVPMGVYLGEDIDGAVQMLKKIANILNGMKK